MSASQPFIVLAFDFATILYLEKRYQSSREFSYILHPASTNYLFGSSGQPLFVLYGRHYYAVVVFSLLSILLDEISNVSCLSG